MLEEKLQQIQKDHTRSIDAIKLDVARKYDELLNKSINSHQTNFENYKHLGII